LNFLKQFALELGLQFALDAVKGYALHQLKDLTAADCYRAITEDIDLWQVTPPDQKAFVQGNLAPKFRKYIIKYADRITPELVLQWLRKDRPDFADVIEKKNQWQYAPYPDNAGYLWLARQVENIVGNIKSSLGGV
jgi:hypothetical protein